MRKRRRRRLRSRRRKVGRASCLPKCMSAKRTWFKHWQLCLLSIWTVLVLCGCHRKEDIPIGGCYYHEVIRYNFSLSFEPGGDISESYLVYKKDCKTIKVGYPGSYGNFSFKMYGSNLVFMEGLWLHPDTHPRLVAHSERQGKVIVDEDTTRYWDILVNKKKITFYRKESGPPQSTNNPLFYQSTNNPQFYSADYLKSL